MRHQIIKRLKNDEWLLVGEAFPIKMLILAEGMRDLLESLHGGDYRVIPVAVN